MDGMAPRDDKKKARTGLRGLPGSSSNSSSGGGNSIGAVVDL